MADLEFLKYRLELFIFAQSSMLFVHLSNENEIPQIRILTFQKKSFLFASMKAL